MGSGGIPKQENRVFDLQLTEKRKMGLRGCERNTFEGQGNTEGKRK